MAGDQLVGEARARARVGQLGAHRFDDGAELVVARHHHLEGDGLGEQPVGIGEVGGCVGEREVDPVLPRQPGQQDGEGGDRGAGRSRRWERDGRVAGEVAGGRGAGPGDLDGVEAGEEVQVVTLGTGQPLVEVGEGGGRALLERRQDLTAAEVQCLVTREVDRRAAESGDPGDLERAVGARDHHAPVADIEDLSRRGRPVRVGDRCCGHEPRRRPRAELGEPERVRVRAERERSHGALQILGGPRPVEDGHGGGSIVPAEGRPGSVGILRTGVHGAACQVVNEISEGVDRRLEVARVERERGLERLDLEGSLRNEVALVDAGRHQVPRDPVGGLAVQQRPRWGVEPGVRR